MSASNKSLLFSLGLVLGLLAGAGFFIFKMDDLLKNGTILNSSKDTIIIQQQVINKEEESTEKKVNKKRTERTDTSKMNSAELLAKKYSKEVPIRRVMAEADSLLNDNSDATDQNTADLFVVRKDELIGSKNFPVTNLQQEAGNSTDSLLEKVSGIKDPQKNALAALKVEFWQSPINYKGYKMTKNKIVLFGVNPEENLKLFHSEDAIFLKQNQNYYRLYFTDEYKQFEKVTDALLISKLK